jgi:hypothetical protein
MVAKQPSIPTKFSALQYRGVEFDTKPCSGPYVVHSVLSNGAVTIMDIKGDRFMVNGQGLKVYFEPDVVPLHHVDDFTIEEEPERPA